MSGQASGQAPRHANDQAVRAARRRQAALLCLWGVLGGLAVLPYALALQADRLAAITQKGGPSLLSLAAIGAVQTSVLVVAAVLLGLAAARRVGLGAPLTWALSCGVPVQTVLGPWPRFLARPLALGLGLGLWAALLDGLWFVPALPALRALGARALTGVALWKGALACFYGGLTEEILLRLLVMSGVALLLKRLWRSQDSPLPAWMLWTANAAAALLFAAGHLPAAGALMPLTPLLIVRTFVLNAGLGLGFGWLYMRRGLEAAMLGHFACDGVLHIAAPAWLLWRGLPS
jgi:hypothetical protein